MQSLPSEVTVHPPDRMHGSYHWDFERFLSVALVPLTVSTVIHTGGAPITDLFLGVVLPLHCHLGFDQVITDYFPARKGKGVNLLAVWGLRAGTVLVLISCYQFNTNDVGLTEFIQRVWTA
jgi:succinate dehydrogenase (ubiquinone) membrane anchor subunit